LLLYIIVKNVQGILTFDMHLICKTFGCLASKNI